MKINKASTNELVIQVKTISWLGTIGTLLIWAGVIFGLIFQPLLLSGSLSLFSIIFCLFLSLFCLLGLAIALSIEEWHFDRVEGQLKHLKILLLSKTVTRYRIQAIQEIELKKYVPDHDDVGGVKWCIFCHLLSGKRVEIYCYSEEKIAQKLTQTIKEYLMLS
ncbi:MAG: hypothetical protein VKJ02_05260 [Snowella sp.]|nr:hypothetical protein [Snowella sp.]